MTLNISVPTLDRQNAMLKEESRYYRFMQIVRRPNSTSPFLINSEKIIRRIFGCGKFERKGSIKYDLKVILTLQIVILLTSF